jgi:Carboxypeptidase regulatory-like domain
MFHTASLRSFVVAVGILALPATALAQSTIAGVVRDTTGAVLPGVTVEAASPVLIEKTRSVVTDGDGRYAIVDLRPGAYSVTFTLPGFNTFKRDGIEVPANVTVPINGELRVGAVEETVTVSGASPVVDVQNISKVQVMTRDLMDAIPSARNIQSVGALVPGVRLNTPDVGGAQQTEQTYMATHGNSALHNTILLDGMPAQTNLSDGAVQNYIDNALIAEAVYKTSGISAETSAGGVFLNLVPKDGGNTIHGQGFFAGSADNWHLQSSNVDAALLNRNVPSTGTRIDHLNDYNFSVGGPVIKDKLWYFGSVRHQGTYVLIPNTFSSDGSPGVEDAWIRSFVVRGTLQATPKNKFAFTYQRNFKWKGHEIAFGGQTGLPIFPDVSATKRDPVLYYIAQGKWTSTITTKLLVEAGYSGDILHYSNDYQDGIAQPRGTPAWFAKTSHLDTLTNGLLARTNAGQSDQLFTPDQHSITGAVSYVTGSHNFKTGMLWGFGNNPYEATLNGDLWQNYQGGTLVNGVYTQGRPTTVTVFNSPLSRSPQLKANIGIFAQDQWVLNRFTVNLGLRWEYLKEDVPAQDRVAGRFAPAQHYDAINCETMPGMTCWKSWSPRLGVAYDLFGDGKTALKASFGQYMTPDSSAFANLFNPVATFTENRNWTDLNGDDIAQDNEIATSNNPSFGKITGRTLDPNFTREYNRQISAGVQHQLRTGMAVTFNWYRRSLYNTAFTLNRAVDPLADWTTTSVVNPLDGSPITIYQIKQNKATGIAPDLYLTNMTDTNLRRNTYTGFEIGSSARLPRRATMFAGWTFERTVDVDCTMNTASASATLNSPNSLRFCDQSGQTYQQLGATAPIPFRHEFKLNASVPLVYGFEASASFQSYAGAQKATTGGLSWAITPSATRYPVDCTVCPAGTPFVLTSRFSGDPGVTVQLVPSGVRYLPRWNQLDLGLRRSFRIGGMTAQAQVTLFNALNSNAVLGEGTGLTTRLNPLLASGLTDPNFTYLSNDPDKGGTPNSILQPRLIQLGVQLKF